MALLNYLLDSVEPLSRLAVELTYESIKAGIKVDKDLPHILVKNSLVGFIINLSLSYPLFIFIKGNKFLSGFSGLLASALISLILSPLTSLFFLKLLSYERGKKVENEIKYLLIAESINAVGSPNLINDISAARHWPSVFKYLSKEGKTIALLRKILTYSEIVKTYTNWIRSTWIKNTLNDFLYSMFLGSLPPWLHLKGREVIDELKQRTKEVIQNRITISLGVAVVLGYVPPIILTMSSLYNEELIAKFLAITLLAPLISVIITPKFPYHLRINKEYLRRSIVVGAGIAVSLTIYLLTGSLRTSIMAVSMTFVGVGVKSTRDLFSGIKEVRDLHSALMLLYEASFSSYSSLDVIKAVFSKKGGIWREIAESLMPLTHSVPISKFRTWIAQFSLFTLMRGVEYGSISRESLSRLAELINESINGLRSAFTANSILAVIAIALPLIMGSILSFSSANNYILSYIIASSLSYAIYASYVLFDDLLNTLLLGVVGIELAVWVI